MRAKLTDSIDKSLIIIDFSEFIYDELERELYLFNSIAMYRVEEVNKKQAEEYQLKAYESGLVDLSAKKSAKCNQPKHYWRKQPTG